jgi:Sec-independent protein translocase protein TatA
MSTIALIVIAVVVVILLLTWRAPPLNAAASRGSGRARLEAGRGPYSMAESHREKADELRQAAETEEDRAGCHEAGLRFGR